MKRKEIEELIKSAGVTDETEIKKAVDEIMKKNGEDVTPLKSQIETLKEDIEVQKGVVETKNNRIKELEEVDSYTFTNDEDNCVGATKAAYGYIDSDVKVKYNGFEE